VFGFTIHTGPPDLQSMPTSARTKCQLPVRQGQSKEASLCALCKKRGKRKTHQQLSLLSKLLSQRTTRSVHSLLHWASAFHDCRKNQRLTHCHFLLLIATAQLDSDEEDIPLLQQNRQRKLQVQQKHKSAKKRRANSTPNAQSAPTTTTQLL